MCYGYIYALENKLKDVGIQMTYCYIPTEEVRTFSERIPFAELEKWFMDLLHEYAKWAVWQIKWQERRNESIQELDFPFEYREGQQRLVKGVYQSILRRKRLYVEAPTGVGKTISTVFPAVKSIGEGVTEQNILSDRQNNHSHRGRGDLLSSLRQGHAVEVHHTDR